jgi:hypothetical protein
VAALIRARECLFGFGHLVVFDEEPGDLECAVGVSALIGADECGRGANQVAPLLE